MTKLITRDKLLEVLPTFESLYQMFSDDSTVTASTIEPVMEAFKQKHSAAFNGELGGIGIDEASDGSCEGFFMFLNTPNKHIFLFSYSLNGEELGFSTDYALGIFDEDGLYGIMLELVPCSTYYMLIEMLVNKVYELLELKDA